MFSLVPCIDFYSDYRLFMSSFVCLVVFLQKSIAILSSRRHNRATAFIVYLVSYGIHEFILKDNLQYTSRRSRANVLRACHSRVPGYMSVEVHPGSHPWRHPWSHLWSHPSTQAWQGEKPGQTLVKTTLAFLERSKKHGLVFEKLC